ncbi:MAG: glycosyltransferase family 2 protein [Anaerolineae bacterium]|jgi:glycosyltransferase involved in cell wall biosynthesis
MNHAEMISWVIPLLNEEESLEALHGAVTETVESLSFEHEIIFVDDGSTDRSLSILRDLYQRDRARVRVFQFRRNFGKTAALAAGFARAQGEIVVTLDADLQDDPAELPKLLAKLDEGYDLVGAWRVHRQDPASKRWPSRFANAVVSALTGIKLHDLNCGFKVYRREVVQDLKLYGELHRFIPVLAHWKGYRVAEVPVTHHSRRFGHSKYGVRRLARGYIDFLSVLFLTTYLKRPMHLFGLVGSGFAAAGTIIMLYLAGLWLIQGGIGWRPLLFFGITALVVGIQLISVGLLGEMLRNATFRAEDEYTIRQAWDDLGEES